MNKEYSTLLAEALEEKVEELMRHGFENYYVENRGSVLYLDSNLNIGTAWQECNAPDCIFSTSAEKPEIYLADFGDELDGILESLRKYEGEGVDKAIAGLKDEDDVREALAVFATPENYLKHLDEVGVAFMEQFPEWAEHIRWSYIPSWCNNEDYAHSSFQGIAEDIAERGWATEFLENAEEQEVLSRAQVQTSLENLATRQPEIHGLDLF